MSNNKDLPVAFEGSGDVVSVLRFDVEADTKDFIFSWDNEDFETEYFAVKVPYFWKGEIKSEIVARLESQEKVLIRMRMRRVEKGDRTVGELDFLAFV